MENRLPHVLVVGNPFDGMTVYGPFEDSDAAMEAGEKLDAQDWWIPFLYPTSELED